MASRPERETPCGLDTAASLSEAHRLSTLSGQIWVENAHSKILGPCGRQIPPLSGHCLFGITFFFEPRLEVSMLWWARATATRRRIGSIGGGGGMEMSLLVVWTADHTGK
jgi:hypothetical protein